MIKLNTHDFLSLSNRVDEINEIIRLAYRENRLDIVDQMLEELDEIEQVLVGSGYEC